MAGKYVPPHLRDKPLTQKNSTVKTPTEQETPVKQTDEQLAVPEVISAASANKDEWHRERNLFKKIAQIKGADLKKQRDKDYNNWIEHYDETLRNMYDEYVHPELMISFDRFVFLAYICSRPEQNTHKQIRPLL